MQLIDYRIQLGGITCAKLVGNMTVDARDKVLFIFSVRYAASRSTNHSVDYPQISRDHRNQCATRVPQGGVSSLPV